MHRKSYRAYQATIWLHDLRRINLKHDSEIFSTEDAAIRTHGGNEPKFDVDAVVHVPGARGRQDIDVPINKAQVGSM